MLRPREGWRAFAGEVAIVVIGVLLALGAQQLVVRWQMGREVAVFRETIDHEIALNLFVYEYRARTTACALRQLSEVETWMAGARSGGTVPGVDYRGTPSFSFDRSAWANRDPDVYGSLPVDVRLKYAEFYDELENNDLVRNTERAQRAILRGYAEPGPLSLAERREIVGAVQSLRATIRLFGENGVVSEDIARDLHIEARVPDGVTPEELAAGVNCASLRYIPPT